MEKGGRGGSWVGEGGGWVRLGGWELRVRVGRR